MKKKVFGYLALGFVTLGGMVATAISTFSWFVASVVTPEYKLSGSSAGAYFAYGDGSVDHPFGISIPRHLYNLSWLQYMGQFSDKQYYFELADSVPDTGLDMTNYYLPPIGTKDEPFVSNFNGNGKIIKNLTVTNDESTIFGSTKHPDRTSVDYKAPEIVGLFGVVGNYNDSLAEANYDTQTNTIYDLGLSNITVQTTTSKALVGIAAGYVDAPISNVAVSEGSININQTNTTKVDNIGTNNLSDYGTIGYATSSYKKSVKSIEQNLYDINIVSNKDFNASDQGDGGGWGGSIDMNSIYQRLKTLRSSATSDNRGYVVNVAHLEDDSEEGWPKKTTSTANNSTQSGTYYFKGYGDDDDPSTPNVNEYTEDYRGSIVYGYSSTGSDTNGKHYLVGGSYQTHTYNQLYNHTGIAIKSGNTNKLSIRNVTANSATVTNETGNSPALWTLSGANSGYLSTLYDYDNNGTQETYYLNNNNGALSISTSTTGRTTWYKTTNGDSVCYATTSDKSSGYYISCTGTTWGLTAIPATPNLPSMSEPDYDNPVPSPQELGLTNPGEDPTPDIKTYNNQLFHIDSNNVAHFISGAANSFSASLTPAQYTWTWNNNRLTYTINRTTYYLKPRNANNTNTSSYVLNASSSTTARDWGGRLGNSAPYRFYIRRNNTNYYYLAYDSSNDNFTLTLSNSNNYTGSETYFYLGTAYEFNGNYYATQNNANNAVTAYHQSQEYLDYLEQKDAWDAANTAYNNYNSAVSAWTSYNQGLEAHNNAVAASFCLNQETITSDNPVKGPDYRQVGSADPAKMYFDYTDTTYFPIKADSTHQASPENTGYFVSGTTDVTWSGSNDSCPRSIIVSSYSKSSKLKGYSNNKFNDADIYTIDDTNNGDPHVLDTTDKVKYSKYATSKSGLEDVLDDGNTVGGFHFFSKNADEGSKGMVGMDSIVEARDIRINGEEYRSYELPVYSLDFQLKEKGRINFFAGMYNGGNDYGSHNSGGSSANMNGFFSFHRVFRNSSNKITDIREVQAIYVNNSKNKWSCIFEYKNGKYSKPYKIEGKSMYELSADDTGTTPYVENHDLTSISTYLASPYNYTKAFDTDWLAYYDFAANSDYWGRVFYFEIPADKGEYCLGAYKIPSSAPTKTRMDGAYLMYLDIGANAAKTQRTIIYEHYNEIKKVFEYPIGIAVVPVSTVTTNITNGTNIDETNTANFLIIAGNTSIGAVTVKRVEDDVTLTRTGGLEDKAKPTLVGDTMKDQYNVYNIHDPGGNNLTNEITSQNTTTDVRRLEYYDYNVIYDELMITHIIDTSTDGTNYTRTFYQQYSDGSSTTTLADMKIYNTEGGGRISSANLEDPATSIIKTYPGENASSVNTTVLLTIKYQEDDGENVVYDWVLSMVVDQNNNTGRFYIFDGYTFQATLENGQVVLEVLAKGSKTVYINGTAITTVGQKVTLTATPANP